MRLYYHLSLPYLSNTYLIGHKSGGAAIIIDPGVMDVQLLELVEKHNYYINSILITNADIAHTNGIKTILKIYNAKIYSGNRNINELESKTVNDGETINLEGFQIEIFGAQGYSRESVMYKINNCLFTGDALTAGMIGHVENTFSKAMLITKIKETFENIKDDTIIFPGYGPPTTKRLEKEFNQNIYSRENQGL